MIGYNTLGTNGRLGNQIFQYASLRGIADKHGYDFCIPPEDHPTYADYALFLTFKMEGVKTGLISGSTLSESGYEFDENLFNTFPDNVNLNGYYQTEKYFKHSEKNVRKDFTFKDDILEACKEYIINMMIYLFYMFVEEIMWVVRITILCQHQNGWVKWSKNIFRIDQY